MLDLPEQPPPHGARGAQRQGDHGPEDRGDGLGDYNRNVGYKTGSITYEFETKTFNYDRGIKLLADVMDVEEAGVLDCFVARAPSCSARRWRRRPTRSRSPRSPATTG